MIIAYHTCPMARIVESTGVTASTDWARTDLVGIEVPFFAQGCREAFVLGTGFGVRAFRNGRLVDPLEPSVLILWKHPVSHLKEDAILLRNMSLE